MAQRGSITYLGSFRDVSYGIDDDGEVFITLADAVAALYARHRSGDWTKVPIVKPNGETDETYFPTVTDEAAIYLWTLDELDRVYAPLLPMHHDLHPIDVHAYMANEPEHVVWVGARQAIRVGAWADYQEQRKRRVHGEVREAGSVVVTDA